MLYYDSNNEAGNSWSMTPAIDRLALARTLLSIIRDGVFFMDSSFSIRYANPVFAKTVGMDNLAHWLCIDPAEPGTDTGTAEADERYHDLQEIYPDPDRKSTRLNSSH